MRTFIDDFTISTMILQGKVIKQRFIGYNSKYMH